MVGEGWGSDGKGEGRGEGGGREGLGSVRGRGREGEEWTGGREEVLEERILAGGGGGELHQIRPLIPSQKRNKVNFFPAESAVERKRLHFISQQATLNLSIG